MFLSFNVDVFAIDKPKIEGISWAILNVCVCVRARVCVCVTLLNNVGLSWAVV